MKNLFAKSSKYNNKPVTIDYRRFDSIMESRFYLDYIKPLKKSGEIKHFLFHPRYILSDTMTYEADFFILWKDGSFEIVDVKGYVTQVFKRKAKRFKEIEGENISLYKLKNKRWIKYGIE